MIRFWGKVFDRVEVVVEDRMAMTTSIRKSREGWWKGENWYDSLFNSFLSTLTIFLSKKWTGLIVSVNIQVLDDME